MKYIHRFGRGVICEVEVVEEAPPKGEAFILNSEWTGKPKMRHLADYRRWMLMIYQEASNRWQKNLMYMLEKSPRHWETWIFEPGKIPRMVGIKRI